MSDIDDPRDPIDETPVDTDEPAELPVPLDAPVDVPVEDLLDQLHEEPQVDEHDPSTDG